MTAPDPGHRSRQVTTHDGGISFHDLPAAGAAIGLAGVIEGPDELCRRIYDIIGEASGDTDALVEAVQRDPNELLTAVLKQVDLASTDEQGASVVIAIWLRRHLVIGFRSGAAAYLVVPGQPPACLTAGQQRGVRVAWAGPGAMLVLAGASLPRRLSDADIEAALAGADASSADRELSRMSAEQGGREPLVLAVQLPKTGPGASTRPTGPGSAEKKTGAPSAAHDSMAGRVQGSRASGAAPPRESSKSNAPGAGTRHLWKPRPPKVGLSVLRSAARKAGQVPGSLADVADETADSEVPVPPETLAEQDTVPLAPNSEAVPDVAPEPVIEPVPELSSGPVPAPVPAPDSEAMPQHLPEPESKVATEQLRQPAEELTPNRVSEPAPNLETAESGEMAPSPETTARPAAQSAVETPLESASPAAPDPVPDAATFHASRLAAVPLPESSPETELENAPEPESKISSLAVPQTAPTDSVDPAPESLREPPSEPAAQTPPLIAPEGAGPPRPRASPKPPPILTSTGRAEPLPYRLALRAIGALLDESSARELTLVETRGTVTVSFIEGDEWIVWDLAPGQMESFYLSLRQRRRWRGTKAAGPYQDFLRSLGEYLDAIEARAILISEIEEGFLLTHQFGGVQQGLSWKKRRVVIESSRAERLRQACRSQRNAKTLNQGTMARALGD
ncbi:MAG TPA: hypothetical protein VFB58_10225 [Chloroflexota bacterium]|nr:hypothetical protein [Chloroflexota bacterium]